MGATAILDMATATAPARKPLAKDTAASTMLMGRKGSNCGAGLVSGWDFGAPVDCLMLMKVSTIKTKISVEKLKTLPSNFVENISIIYSETLYVYCKIE